MRRVEERPYRLDPTRSLYLGWSSWNPEAKAVKFAWPTASGTIARGGEMPLDAVPDLVALVTEHQWLTWDDIFTVGLEDCPTPGDVNTRTLQIAEALLRVRAAQVAKVKPEPPKQPEPVETNTA